MDLQLQNGSMSGHCSKTKEPLLSLQPLHQVLSYPILHLLCFIITGDFTYIVERNCFWLIFSEKINHNNHNIFFSVIQSKSLWMEHTPAQISRILLKIQLAGD